MRNIQNLSRVNNREYSFKLDTSSLQVSWRQLLWAPCQNSYFLERSDVEVVLVREQNEIEIAKLAVSVFFDSLYHNQF